MHNFFKLLQVKRINKKKKIKNKIKLSFFNQNVLILVNYFGSFGFLIVFPSFKTQ
jgi:hypothetical protein